MESINVQWIDSDDMPKGLNKSFAHLFENTSSNTIIQNVNTQLKFIQAGEYIFPITINEAEKNNSFVCSPYNAYAEYLIDEVKQEMGDSMIQYPIIWLVKLIGPLLRLGKIDKNIHVNNYMLSTNPYPEWNGQSIQAITDFLYKEYPDHALIFRSINDYQHADLLKEFDRVGYQKIGSRQVYIYDMDYKTWYKRNNNKQDKRLIKKSNLIYVPHEEMEPFLEEGLILYNKLYLEKYSNFNPQLTLDYLQTCYKENIVHYQGYKDENDVLQAFTGLFIVGNTMTCPILGYDTHQPIQRALYIHAINTVMTYKFETDLLLNLSSGASKFKRLRGGQPSIEYSTVYNKHLSLGRRFMWRILSLLSNKIGVPMLKKYEL